MGKFTTHSGRAPRHTPCDQLGMMSPRLRVKGLLGGVLLGATLSASCVGVVVDDGAKDPSSGASQPTSDDDAALHAVAPAPLQANAQRAPAMGDLAFVIAVGGRNHVVLETDVDEGWADSAPELVQLEPVPTARREVRASVAVPSRFAPGSLVQLTQNPADGDLRDLKAEGTCIARVGKPVLTARVTDAWRDAEWRGEDTEASGSHEHAKPRRPAPEIAQEIWETASQGGIVLSAPLEPVIGNCPHAHFAARLDAPAPNVVRAQPASRAQSEASRALLLRTSEASEATERAKDFSLDRPWQDTLVTTSYVLDTADVKYVYTALKTPDDGCGAFFAEFYGLFKLEGGELRLMRTFANPESIDTGDSGLLGLTVRADGGVDLLFKESFLGVGASEAQDRRMTISVPYVGCRC
jgi:hypothetical protein